MFCIYCGTQLPDDALFCNKCGRRQGEAANERATADVALLPFPTGSAIPTGNGQPAVGNVPMVQGTPTTVESASGEHSAQPADNAAPPTLPPSAHLRAAPTAPSTSSRSPEQQRQPSEPQIHQQGESHPHPAYTPPPPPPHTEAPPARASSPHPIGRHVPSDGFKLPGHLSRRAVIVGLAGATAAVAGGTLAWRALSQNQQASPSSSSGGSNTATTSTNSSPSATWSPAGNLITARQQHTATLLQNGKVLVAGGTDNDTLSSAELYDPTSGTWSPTGALVTARYKHTATLLQNGKVLVTGGWNSNSNSLSSAELYDPTSGTWSPTGTLITAREQHTATLLQNGKVLVTGGLKRARDSNGSEVTDHLSSAELYDPANGTWSPTGTLITAREQHTATLLENGKVLVTGGLNSFNLDAPISSAELYDPASGTWSATGSLRVGRTDQAATLLPKAKVLVTGGIVGSNPLSSTELYDPVSGTWSSTAAMSVGRWFHTVTLLRSGKVLVTGGSNGYASVTPLSSAELYDPASSSWSPASNLITARYNHTATLLKNGKVLVAGGTDNSNPLSSSELYG